MIAIRGTQEFFRSISSGLSATAFSAKSSLNVSVKDHVQAGDIETRYTSMFKGQKVAWYPSKK